MFILAFNELFLSLVSSSQIKKFLRTLTSDQARAIIEICLNVTVPSAYKRLVRNLLLPGDITLKLKAIKKAGVKFIRALRTKYGKVHTGTRRGITMARSRKRTTKRRSKKAGPKTGRKRRA